MRMEGWKAEDRTICLYPGKRIGILGGTFNPPHVGHLRIGEIAYTEFELDEVLILPSGLPPHKPGGDVLERALRRRMTELFAKEREYFVFCPMELDREGYTYTVDTLLEMRARYGPEVEFYYIIGTDTLFELETWRDYKKVFSLTKFICVPRPGDSPEDIQNQMAALRERYGAQILLAQQTGPDISSTEIRKLARSNMPLRGVVPEAIWNFMEKNHVFGK